MRFQIALVSALSLLLCSCAAQKNGGNNYDNKAGPASACPPGSAVEGLTQAGYKTAWYIDSQNYTNLGEVFTQDVFYDSSALGPYGGTTRGLEQTKQAIQAAGKGAKVEHLVTNLFVKELQTPTQARVITYITLSHWNPDALNDISKTFRIYYQCDDIWVCQDSAWKMKHSIVSNMGVGVEQPYNVKPISK